MFRFVHGELSTEERYWQISDVTPEALDGRQAVEALATTLCKGAQKIERQFKRPVCDLTGGYDSRAVVAAFLMGKVSFWTTVSGPENSADVIISKGIAGMSGFAPLTRDLFPTTLALSKPNKLLSTQMENTI